MNDICYDGLTKRFSALSFHVYHMHDVIQRRTYGPVVSIELQLLFNYKTASEIAVESFVQLTCHQKFYFFIFCWAE